MNEFEQAEAALAAMRQAEYEEQQHMIAQAEADAAEAEARLAALHEADEVRDAQNDSPIAISDGDSVQGIPTMRTGYAQTHVGGIDPTDSVNLNETITITSTDGTSQSFTVNQGLWADAMTQPVTTFTEPLTEQDITDAIDEIVLNIEPPTSSTPVKTKKTTSKDFDAVGFLSIERIKIELQPILEDLYPERWSWTKKDEILIHFPAFTIINSRGERHDIKDLYTKLTYSHINKTFDGYVDGTRMSITNSELNGNYAHSHLPSISKSNVGAFNGFCLGRSTLSMLLSDLATLEMVENKLEDVKLRFMLVLMELENYLQWESLEGGPYRQMSNINSGKLRGLSTSDTRMLAEPILENIWMNIKANEYRPQMKFNHKGLLEVINNDGFLMQVSKYCNSSFLLYRDGTGKFFSTKREDSSPLGKIESNSNKFKFRGKTIYPQLIDDVIIYEESGKDFAHPKIVDKCKAVIQESINQSWGEELARKVVSHYISRQRKVKSTRKSLFTNLKNVRDSIEA